MVNLNKRYHGPPNTTAYFIDALSGMLQCDVDLVVIGDCHGDLQFSRKVAQQTRTPRVNLVGQQSLKELAHSIAGASFFIGSSMHGFITALSYKTPALLVLNERPMHKFRGLLKLLNINEKTICPNWKEAIERMHKATVLPEEEQSRVAQVIDQHWNNIFEAANTKPQRRTIRPIEFWESLVYIDRIIQRSRKRLREVLRR